MDTTQSLETISGDLRAYAQLVPGTFQHVDQLTRARMTDEGLCQTWLYTADGNAYKPGKGSSVLWGLTREADNLILKHLFDEENSSYAQLINTGGFIPEPAESAQAFKQAEVMDLTKFRLQGNDAVYRQLQIRTADGYTHDGKRFVPPNSEEKKALPRIGFTEQYLSFLADNSIKLIETTNLYVLNPDYVQKKAVGGNTLWRVSWLSYFDCDSSFGANLRDVDNHGALRGVRRVVVVPAGDAPKNLEVPKCSI